MTAFVLKLLASICMLIDHAGDTLFPGEIILRYIGRMPFPVYCFLIAQGCRFSKHMDKYLGRLAVFALISEIPFDLAFMQWGDRTGWSVSFLSNANVFYTLFLGALAAAVYQRAQTKQRPWLLTLPTIAYPAVLLLNFIPETDVWWLRPLTIARAFTIAHALFVWWFSGHLKDRAEDAKPQSAAWRAGAKLIGVAAVLPLFGAGNMLHTDYGLFGVLLIFAFYIAETVPINLPAAEVWARRAMRAAVCLAAVWYEYGQGVFQFYYEDGGGFGDAGYWLISRYQLGFFIGGLASVALIALYNGKRGPRVKWAFYAFYPAHLAALAVIMRVGV